MTVAPSSAPNSDAVLIAACLNRYREHCIQQDEAQKAERLAGATMEPFKVLDFSEITRQPSPEERVAILLEDPVRSALRGKVREIGWRLWIGGGTDLMREVSDEVEDLCAGRGTFAGATLDRWWDGIGWHGKDGGVWVA